MALTLCRSRFTPHDFQFVLDRLSSQSSQSSSLKNLCQDPEAFSQILDLEPLHRSLVDEPHCVPVSPAFYFYVLVRRELLRHGLDDRNLCDYIASVLTEFSERKTLEKAPVAETTRSFAFVSDILKSIDQAPTSHVYHLRKFLADYSLFLSGIFKSNADAQRHGAPGLNFYEAIGQQSYRSAAAQPQARQDGLRDILEMIAEAFHEVRLSLNEMSDRRLHI